MSNNQKQFGEGLNMSVKKLLTGIVLVTLFGGCSNNEIDKTDICKKEITIPEPPVACLPVPCEETVYGNLEHEWLDRVQTETVKLEHYINGNKVEENLADVVDVNGSLGTSNPITIPQYEGTPIKHVLIVEFYQTN